MDVMVNEQTSSRGDGTRADMISSGGHGYI